MRNRRGVVAVLASLVVAVSLAACGDDEERDPDALVTTPARIDQKAYADELVELTNSARVEEGLEPLEESVCARQAGVERAAALVGQDDLVHAPLAPVIKACAPMTSAAENLVNSRAAAADVVQAWLESPGHRANIVDSAMTHVGIGCLPDGEKLLCSQIFLGP